MSFGEHVIQLNDAREMPLLGLGVYKATEDAELKQAIGDAVSFGYHLIDTASFYKNEEGIGKALKTLSIPREDLFITTKIWNTAQRIGDIEDSFHRSLERLGLDYVDLYLIHWPRPFRFHDDYIEQNRASWRAMEDLVQEGRIRAIGVSNFKEHHLRELMEDARILPAVNQIEFHPSCLQEDIRSFCAEQHIVVQGYSTLANGQVFHCEELLAISREQNISLSRLCTQYARQRGVVPLVKSVDPARIRENLQLDFCLSPAVLEQIDRVTGCAGSGNDSDAISF